MSDVGGQMTDVRSTLLRSYDPASRGRRADESTGAECNLPREGDDDIAC